MLVAVIGIIVGTIVTAAITLKLRNDISVLKRELAGAQKSYRTAESHADQYAEELESNDETHSKELLEVENRLQEAAEQQRQTEERLQRVTHELAALHTSTKTVVAAHTKPLQEEIEQERSNVTKHITRVETAVRTIETLRQEKLELEKRINKLTDDAAEAQNEATRLALEITTKDRELATLREKITELTDDADEAQSEATRLALEITTKDRELATLRARLVDAADSKRDLEKLLGETFRKAEALLKPERIIPVASAKEDS